MQAPGDLLTRRPAEAAGVAGAFAVLLAHLLGVTDPDAIVALAVVVGFVPAAVTWLVTLLRSRP
jgi:hypothetical protein